MRSWRNIAISLIDLYWRTNGASWFRLLAPSTGVDQLVQKGRRHASLTDAPLLRATVTFPLKRCGATFQSELRAIASQILAALLPCR